jgi:hypothetical protein
MNDDLRKGFLRDFTRRWDQTASRPWSPRIPRGPTAGPHAARFAREAGEKVAQGKWSRGRAQSTLDRSMKAPPTETRAAPEGARGYGGGGFSGGVSRQLGTAPAAGWVAPPKPRLAKATTHHPDPAAAPQPHPGAASVTDDELRKIIARETATPEGQELFQSIMEGLDACEKAFAIEQTRPMAEEMLEKWSGDDAHPLRKAMAGAWLERARGVASGVAAAYKKGADKAQAAGSKFGARRAEGSEGYAAAARAGRIKGEMEMHSRLRAPGGASSARRGFADEGGRAEVPLNRFERKAKLNAGDNSAAAAASAYAGGVARKTGVAARRAYHGAAGLGAAGAVAGGGYALAGRRRGE